MESIDTTTKALKKLKNRYDTFIRLFNVFQNNISNCVKGSSAIEGLSIESNMDDMSIIKYLGKTYQLQFSMKNIKGSPKGNITFFDVSNSERFEEVASTIFDGNGITDIPASDNEEFIDLKEDIMCIQLFQSWLLQGASK